MSIRFRLTFGSWLLICVLSPSAVAQLRSEAYAGEPFGVGRVTLPASPQTDALAIRTNGYFLSAENGRALYPSFSSGRAVGVLRQVLGVEERNATGPVTFYFLFRGTEPFTLTVATPELQEVRVHPNSQPRAYRRLLRAWWRNYSAAAQQRRRQGDYPPLIETYLTTVLGQRLGLRAPLLERLVDSERRTIFGNRSLRRLFHVESIRLEALRESLSPSSNRMVADQPVPADIRWSNTAGSDLADDVDIEPIAAHVPEECLYVRFGNFENYLWLRELMDEYGGDMSRMVTARGHDAGLNRRLQDQLGLEESTLAKLFGGQVISDVAMIGRDTYMREGAAFGILFEARNSGLLKTDLVKQRLEAVERMKEDGAEMTEVEIAGQPVSLAVTADNRLRSFYVANDKYHLVTTSRAIAERFLEVGRGVRPLAATPAFRLARQRMPLAREDTIFVYLSPAFFRGLMGPQYQIELRRRLRAVTDLEVLAMAKWVARVEQRDDALPALLAARLLPQDIQQRPDGSRPMELAGRWVDSLRGGRGSFLPIPDVELTGVTAEEAADYRQTAAFHQSQWEQMDPLIIALKRFAGEEDGRERLRLEARMQPFDRKKYGLVTSVVGPPSQTQLRPDPQDILSLQLVLQGGLLRPNVEPHLLFLGLRDSNVPLDLGRNSLLRTLMILRSAPAYLGAWPQLGLLELLGLGSTPDAQGFSQLPLGLWRRQTPDRFSVLSFDPAILDAVVPRMALERSEHRAQVRVRVGDFAQSQIRGWLNALGYQRAYETSVGNTRLLHTVTQQLGVPPEQAKDVAESILDVNLVCTLDGEYELRETTEGWPFWASTGWPDVRATAPAGNASSPEYTAPALQWFHGLDADLVMLSDRVIAYATVDLQRQPQQKAPEIKLPLFDLFRDNPFRRPEEEVTPIEEEPFEELPPPRPEPIQP